MNLRRLIAPIAVGAALVLGTTGCSMISPQATTIEYSAAEGVNVYASGPLDVRNVFIVANEDGSAGNLVAAIVNQTDESHTLRIELGEGDSSQSFTQTVPARSTVSLGADGEEPILVDGALPYLAPLVPTSLEAVEAP